MKYLSDDDIYYLKSIGYEPKDLQQIDEAIAKTKYTIWCATPGGEEKNISWKKAKMLLGTYEFLNGVARSAFHRTAARECGVYRGVYFDSSRLFK